MLEAIDHVNLVVHDLHRMADFYTRVLGFLETKRVRIRGDWIDRTVGLTGVDADVVYLDLPAGPRLELIRYHQPSGPRPEGSDRPNAQGLRHLAFRVADIDGMLGTLRANGVEPFSQIQRVPDDQVTYAGGVRKRLVYFPDPEGNLLELCEYR